MEPSLATELIRGAATLLAATLGGALVMLGAWIADRRKNRTEQEKIDQHERALLTGAFSVNNFINSRLNDWIDDGRIGHLRRLKPAQHYLQRLVDRSPLDSERLMVAVVDASLRLDALLETIATQPPSIVLREQSEFSERVERDVNALVSSIELVEILVEGKLTFMSEDDLAQFPTLEEVLEDNGR